MKIMYLNPVGVKKYDTLFSNIARDCKEEETEIHVTSLNSEVGSFDNLESRIFEAFVYKDIIRAVRQASSEGFDAFIVGCFYDTALLNAREISGEMVVVGPCHSSVEFASSISNSISIIIGNHDGIPHLTSNLRRYGYLDKIRSIEVADLHVTEFQTNTDLTLQRLLNAGRKAINIHHAESLILGCTLEAGYFKAMQETLCVPVIDCSIAAIKKAETMAIQKLKMGWKPSRKWSSKSLSEEQLSTLFDLDNYVYGNRIVIN